MTARALRLSQLAVALVLLLNSGSPSAQSAGSPAAAVDRLLVIRGTVVTADAPSAQLVGARVAATWLNGGADSVLTDRKGSFEIRVPGRAAYRLVVTKPGFVASVIQPAASTDPLHIQLTRGAVITGRVTDASGDDVAGIRVRVRRIPIQSGELTALPEVLTDTDDSGEYRVGSLAAGNYEVRLEFTSAPSPNATVFSMRYEQPISAPGVVEVKPGEQVSVDLRYEALAPPPPPPGWILTGPTSIAGRILNADGAPVAGVWAMAWPLAAGRVRSTQSDVAGRYELGVDPGQYRIQATKQGYVPVEYGQQAAGQLGKTIAVEEGRQSRADIRLSRGRAIAGRVVDANGEPVEGMAVRIVRVEYAFGRMTARSPDSVRLRRTDDRGQYRIYGLLPGTYYVAALPDAARPTGIPIASSKPWAPPESLELGRAASLYAPGTPSIADATRITVTDAADVDGVDIAYLTRPTARIHGLLRQASGQPLPNTLVTLALSARSSPVVPASRNAISDAGGAFEFRNVAAGEYFLRANTRQSGAAVTRYETGTQFVQVADADVGPLLMSTAPGSVVAGRIRLEDAQADVLPSSFTIAGFPADPDESATSGLIGDDGSLEIPNLRGTVRFALTRAPDGWWLKSMQIGGRNAADDPVQFGGPEQSYRDVEVVLSRAGGILSGRVLDERNDPVLDYSVVVFSTDRGKWFYRSRHMKAGRPDDAGGYAVDALPAGEYFVAAIDAAVTADNWQNPEFLNALVPSARRVRVEAGGRVSTDLRLARISP